MSRPSTTPAPTTTVQTNPTINVDIQNQMIQRFSQQSGMNIEYSKL